MIWEVALVGAGGAAERFETTDNHPWWIVEQDGSGRWVETTGLAPGMTVVSLGAEGRETRMAVAAVVETSRVDATYNLSVADFETYFVGEQRVLVHNCPGSTRQGAAELPDPFPADAVREPESHPGAKAPSRQARHGHVGPVDHIPVR